VSLGFLDLSSTSYPPLQLLHIGFQSRNPFPLPYPSKLYRYGFHGFHCEIRQGFQHVTQPRKPFWHYSGHASLIVAHSLGRCQALLHLHCETIETLESHWRQAHERREPLFIITVIETVVNRGTGPFLLFFEWVSRRPKPAIYLHLS